MTEPHTAAAPRWLRPMKSRDPHEPHRASTPLELLFDLCFVVAVAQAAAKLHHGIAEGHFASSLLGFTFVFFAIWWAWMNFTWFASAYDTDDVPYRIKVFVQIAGVLTLAAGVPRAFDQLDFSVVTLGYAIMRVALIAHWLRAARADGPRRRTALRYAIGIAVCEAGWLSIAWLPRELWMLGWCVLMPAELLTPMWAERATRTEWHPHHISERYGLLTLIVLGESVLAATVAIQTVIDHGALTWAIGALIVGGLVTLFCLWWLYFDRSVAQRLKSSWFAFVWGYAHFFIFAALASVGAGLAVSVDVVTGHAHVSSVVAGLAVAIPVALFIVSVWALLVRPNDPRGIVAVSHFAGAALVLAAAFAPWPIFSIGLLLALLLFTTKRLTANAA